MASSYPMVRLHREVKALKRIPGRKPFFPPKLPYARQVQRLEQKLGELTTALNGLEKGLDVSADPRAVVPERALVMELAAPVGDFALAAQALGFEWLACLAPSEDGAAEEEDEETESGNVRSGFRTLYVTMPSLEGLRRLLASWKRFKAEQRPVKGEEGLFKLFDYLEDLRTWSAKDRIDPTLARYVRKLLQKDPKRPVLVEVDLWYRSAKERRDSAVETLRTLVEHENGKVHDFVDIEPIRYQGALVELPAAVAARLVEGVEGLPSLDEVMTIRPQAAFEPEFSQQESAPATMEAAGGGLRPALAAILDGYPVDEHQALKGRVVVREVDVRGRDVPPAQRSHGTAMASLVLHGDLGQKEESLTRKLVAVPILGVHPNGKESTPVHRLAIGVVHRALSALVEGRKSDPALASVVAVNHSLCDTNAPFAGRASPWAALLDHYSHEHKLLFVVSAGNIFDPFPAAGFSGIADLGATEQVERQAKILVAFERSLGTRGIFSPAESVNSLTVGAVHMDSATDSGSELDPYPGFAMTNLASAVGPGVNRSIKPDILAPGGRFAAAGSLTADGEVQLHAQTSAKLGQLVAHPSPTGDLRRVIRSAGTSNAAALVTRSCVLLGDALDAVFADEGSWLDRPTRVAILKALATHGCRWGIAGNVLEQSFRPEGARKFEPRRGKISNVLGYGAVDVARVASGAGNRVTLLGDGLIRSDELHEFRLPVPPVLLKTNEVRSITLTLAWTTPIITTTADYRAVALNLVDATGKADFWEGVAKTGLLQPTARRMKRGTLVHVCLEGKKKVRELADERGVFVGVQASARHPDFGQAGIPYALAVTIEMAQSQLLYQQVRDAVRARGRARVQARRS